MSKPGSGSVKGSEPNAAEIEESRAAFSFTRGRCSSGGRDFLQLMSFMRRLTVAWRLLVQS